MISPFWCAHCQRAPDHWEIERVIQTRSHRLMVRCHGVEAVEDVPDEILLAIGPLDRADSRITVFAQAAPPAPERGAAA